MKLLEAKHGFMLVNPLDMYVGRSLCEYGEFSEKELEMLLELIPSDGEAVVIEVGANIGALTVPMARKAGVVIAFEPQRLVFQTLCANIALNEIWNVRTWRAAVGPQPGYTMVPDLDPERENNFGGLSAFGHDQGEQVSVVPLDAIQLPRVDLIKIDVEGFELEVLQGATGMIKHFRPALYIEDDREENRDDLRAYITEELDYEFVEHNTMLFNYPNHFDNKDDVFTGAGSFNLACYPSAPAILHS